MKIWAFHQLRFRENKNRLFLGGERLRDYILWKITHPLPIVHNLWKFELSIIYGLDRAKIAYFGVVRGCVTIFCEKSRILSLLCTICENLSFLSFTVLERVKSLILGCWEVAWLFCALYNLTVLYWGSRSPSPQGHKPSKERCCLLGWQQATEVIPQSGRVYILLSIVTLWDSHWPHEQGTMTIVLVQSSTLLPLLPLTHWPNFHAWLHTTTPTPPHICKIFYKKFFEKKLYFFSKFFV